MALDRDSAGLAGIRPPPRPASDVARGTVRHLLQLSLDAVVVMDSDGKVAEWNQRASELFGWTREEAIGRDMASLIIPLRHRDAHNEGLAHFLATGEGPMLNQRVETSAVRRSGEEFPVELTIQPMQYADGWLFIGSVRDLTEQRRAEQYREQQALRAEVLHRIITFATEPHTFEEALQLCLDSVHRLTGWPVGHIYLPTDREPVILMPSNLWHGIDDPRYAALREVTANTYLSPGEGLPGRVWQTRGPVWIADVATDEQFTPTRGGRELNIRSAFGFPIVSNGRVIAIVEFFSEGANEPDADMVVALRSIGDQVGRVFERRQAEQALREQAEALEIAYRINLSLAGELDLDRLIEAFTDAATRISAAAFGAFLYHAPGESSGSYVLYARTAAPRSAFEKHELREDAATFSARFANGGPVLLEDATAANGGQAPHPLLNGLPQGYPPVRSYLAVPVVSRSGEILGGLVLAHPTPGRFTARHRDIVTAIAVQASIGIDNARQYRRLQVEAAERQKGEEHQKLLLAELNHRVKNMLAVVTGIASQTARSSRSVAAFNENFIARLSSLGRAHTLLTAGNWGLTSLRSLIEELVMPHAPPEEERIQASGPPLALRPKPALAVSMILHELVTNATKYGALSVPNGRIFVEWSVSPGEAGEVRLTWRETGLVDFNRPRRVGFGTRMIQASAQHELGGGVDVRYEPEGIWYEFRFPMNQ